MKSKTTPNARDSWLQFLALFVAATSPASILRGADPIADEKLEGVWRITRLENLEEDDDGTDTLGTLIRIRGDRLTMTSPQGDESLTCVVRLDPAKSHINLHFTLPGEPRQVIEIPGIYAISGNSLKLCLAQGDPFSRCGMGALPGARPKTFSDKQTLVIVSDRYSKREPLETAR